MNAFGVNSLGLVAGELYTACLETASPRSFDCAPYGAPLRMMSLFVGGDSELWVILTGGVKKKSFSLDEIRFVGAKKPADSRVIKGTLCAIGRNLVIRNGS